MGIKRIIQKSVLQLPPAMQAAVSFPLTKFALYRQTQHLTQATSEVAQYIEKYSHPDQPRIFIDGGCNNGTTLKAFIETLPKDFEFFGFEIQDELLAKLENVKKAHPDRKIEIKHAGLSDENGEIDYYPSNIVPWGGLYDRIATTTVADRNMPVHLDYKTVKKAPAINFSKFLEDIFNQYSTNETTPFIAIKFNIEGTEYPILKRVIEDGNLDKIGFITAEFHASKPNDQMNDELHQQHQKIMHALQESDIPVHDWTLKNSL